MPLIVVAEPAQTPPVKPGDVLAGKYRVERVLGVGGMGVVVSATHLQLDQLVALKFMLPGVLGNADAVSRFLREAKAVVRLRGEHVARVLDVGTLDNLAPYIVMEYLAGDDLFGVLRQRGPLPLAEASWYVLQACEAMAEAHAANIIHRDLKPQNLFLTKRPDGTPLVKVLDFGISKTAAADAKDGQATHTSTMMGSPSYMSPEQIRSAKDVDVRTDIWALGVILYQLLSGKLPFNANTVVELCVQVMHKDYVPLRDLVPALPTRMDALVSRCLLKDRDKRFGNVAEFVAELATFAPHAGQDTLQRVSRLLNVAAPMTGEIPPTMPATSTSDQPVALATTLGSASGVTSPDAPRSSLRFVGLLLAGVALAVGATIALTRGGPTKDVEPPHAAVPSMPVIVVSPPPSQAVPPAPQPVQPAPPSVDAGVAVASPPDASAPVVVVHPPPTPSPPRLGETIAPAKPPVATVPVTDPPVVPVVSPPVSDPPPAQSDPYANRH